MDMSELPATGEANSAKLCQLSDEVSRIAATLAHLAMQPDRAATSYGEQSANDELTTDTSIEAVRNAIRVRRLRYQFFEKRLFADPIWDMLLDLFQAELDQRRVAISSLSLAAAVPATTALRCLKVMTDAGLCQRSPDPHDARRVVVKLSPKASSCMRSYFNKLEEALLASD